MCRLFISLLKLLYNIVVIPDSVKQDGYLYNRLDNNIITPISDKCN